MRWKNILSWSKTRKAMSIEWSALRMVWRHGRPTTVLHFLGGLGDELLLTCVARELKRRNAKHRIWQISAAESLLRGNPDYTLALGSEHWSLRHSNVLERWRVRLSYAEQVLPGVYDVPPREHILAILCRKAGIRGCVKLRPWFHQTRIESAAGRIAQRQISIQSVGRGTHETWMLNKTWFHERFQEVVDVMKKECPGLLVIQLGSGGDFPLDGVMDLRGKTSLRETAAILGCSACFVGTSGLLVHLARAVDCRSVVIYGGREHSWQSGYCCNENLDSQLSCAPCWLWNDCDYERDCMRRISAAQVVAAVERLLARAGGALELEVDEAMIDEDGVHAEPKTTARVPGARIRARHTPFDS